MAHTRMREESEGIVRGGLLQERHLDQSPWRGECHLCSYLLGNVMLVVGISPRLLVYIPDSQRYFQAVIHEVHGGSK